MNSSDDWPNYLPGPSDHLEALGVVSLTYGYLEGLFQCLFTDTTGMTPDQVNALFQRIPNNHRSNMMLELLDKSKLPTNLKELVRYFVKGFETCAENRSGLMHSHSAGIVSGMSSGHYGFVFTKNSKAGNRLVCTPTLTDLRQVADSMHDYAVFAGMVGNAIHDARLTAKAADSTWLPPSLDKPAPPPSLHWQSEKDFQASLIRPTTLLK